MLEHIIGFTASTIAFVQFVPQAVRVWHLRNDPVALSGVSLATQSLVITNAILWFLYSAVTGAFWVSAPGYVTLPLALITIYFVIRARNHPATLAAETVPVNAKN